MSLVSDFLKRIKDGRRRHARRGPDGKFLPADAAPAPEETVEQLDDATKYIATDDGNVTLVRFGKTYSIDTAHPNYDLIKSALADGRLDDLDRLLDIPELIETMEDVTVNRTNGTVLYRGKPIGGTIVNRILQFIREGEDFKPLALFLSRLMKNPSGRAVNELYTFLEHEGMAITEDGYFIGYKGVREDFMDKHSGTFDNSPGQKPRIERNEVDDDCTRTCSFGLHVGTREYAQGWGARVVKVKIDPADAVSVPKESGSAKLRVCGYEVLEECTGLVTDLVYRKPTEEPDDEIEDETEDCIDCGEIEDDCVCYLEDEDDDENLW